MTAPDAYATHLPALTAALLCRPDRADHHHSPPAYLELGAGHYSTPILRLFASRLGGRLCSVETDREYLDQLTKTYPPIQGTHEYIHSPELSDRVWLDYDFWDVVLIDCRPETLRGRELYDLRGRAAYIVCHDMHSETWWHDPRAEGDVRNLWHESTIAHDRRIWPETAVFCLTKNYAQQLRSLLV